MKKETVVVIDFETTGLSPDKGARATEVAAVRLVDDEIVEQFQSLINPGIPIPPFIESLTGISNTMVQTAPAASAVMPKLAAFISSAPLVAHNARFDHAFLQAEYARSNLPEEIHFACTMKLAMRIYPRAPSYKLGALLEYADVSHQGRFHRALSDAMAAARLWLQIKHDLAVQHRISPLNHEVMRRIANRPDYWKMLNAGNPQGGGSNGK